MPTNQLTVVPTDSTAPTLALGSGRRQLSNPITSDCSRSLPEPDSTNPAPTPLPPGRPSFPQFCFNNWEPRQSTPSILSTLASDSRLPTPDSKDAPGSRVQAPDSMEAPESMPPIPDGPNSSSQIRPPPTALGHFQSPTPWTRLRLRLPVIPASLDSTSTTGSPGSQHLVFYRLQLSTPDSTDAPSSRVHVPFSR